mmetsp:Transcript_32054/g.60260  ORF Transcript_32054/g.60260 Transcript_32054/m.60260 type:complete len:336 (+) Transcript_32054:1431-2438(+)
MQQREKVDRLRAAADHGLPRRQPLEPQLVHVEQHLPAQRGAHLLHQLVHVVVVVALRLEEEELGERLVEGPGQAALGGEVVQVRHGAELEVLLVPEAGHEAADLPNHVPEEQRAQDRRAQREGALVVAHGGHVPVADRREGHHGPVHRGHVQAPLALAVHKGGVGDPALSAFVHVPGQHPPAARHPVRHQQHRHGELDEVEDGVIVVAGAHEDIPEPAEAHHAEHLHDARHAQHPQHLQVGGHTFEAQQQHLVRKARDAVQPEPAVEVHGGHHAHFRRPQRVLAPLEFHRKIELHYHVKHEAHLHHNIHNIQYQCVITLLDVERHLVGGYSGHIQ